MDTVESQTVDSVKQETPSSSRPRRSLPSSDERNTWECSVCTFRNPKEAFKCDMCDTRKGTSTRKPRTNQQQVIIHQVSVQQVKKEKKQKKLKLRSPARLKNIDRSTANHTVVTVGDVTVIITEYQPKAPPPSASASTVHVEDSQAMDTRSYASDSDADSA